MINYFLSKLTEVWVTVAENFKIRNSRMTEIRKNFYFWNWNLENFPTSVCTDCEMRWFSKLVASYSLLNKMRRKQKEQFMGYLMRYSECTKKNAKNATLTLIYSRLVNSQTKLTNRKHFVTRTPENKLQEGNTQVKTNDQGSFPEFSGNFKRSIHKKVRAETEDGVVNCKWSC